MHKIDELIRRYDSDMGDEGELRIQAKLKMIKNLFAEIQEAKDAAYTEEIIDRFLEIICDLQDTIDDQTIALAKAAGYGPPCDTFLSAVHPVKEEPSLPSCLPPEEGFQTDEQVKKAFTNYLTYHVNRKTKKGKEKPFSIHTIYDYSSRLKVLWEIVYAQWQEGGSESRIPLDAQNILPGATFLNAYHNIEALHQYVRTKEWEQQEIAKGLRQPVLTEEAQKNPLNNPRNLANSSAALSKFAAFKKAVAEKGQQ